MKSPVVPFVSLYYRNDRKYLKPLGTKMLQRYRKEEQTVTPRDWSELYMTECDWLKGNHVTKGSFASE